MLRYYGRPLTREETDSLRGELRQLEARKRGFRRFTAVASALVLLIGLPLAITQAEKDINLLYLAIAVLAVYIGIIVWVYRENLGDARARATSLRSAIDRSQARVVHCQAADLVAFTEVEDEGAGWLFQVDEEAILFLGGQMYYETARFPSTDFEMVETLDGDGGVAQFRIDVRGEKLQPLLTITAEVKLRLVNADLLPEDLTVIDGTLADVEQRLLAGTARLSPVVDTG